MYPASVSNKRLGDSFLCVTLIVLAITISVEAGLCIGCSCTSDAQCNDGVQGSMIVCSSNSHTCEQNKCHSNWDCPTGNYCDRFWTCSSQLLFPVTSSSLSWESNNFGERRDSGARCHAGCDLNTRDPYTVRAMADGIVKSNYYFYTCTYGKNNAVFIYHPHLGITMNYGELLASSIRVSVGQTVRRGTVIGTASPCRMMHAEVYQGEVSENSQWYPAPNVVLTSAKDACVQQTLQTKPYNLLNCVDWFASHNLERNDCTLSMTSYSSFAVGQASKAYVSSGKRDAAASVADFIDNAQVSGVVADIANSARDVSSMLTDVIRDHASCYRCGYSEDVTREQCDDQFLVDGDKMCDVAYPCVYPFTECKSSMKCHSWVSQMYTYYRAYGQADFNNEYLDNCTRLVVSRGDVIERGEPGSLECLIAAGYFGSVVSDAINGHVNQSHLCHDHIHNFTAAFGNVITKCSRDTIAPLMKVMKYIAQTLCGEVDGDVKYMAVLQGIAKLDTNDLYHADLTSLCTPDVSKVFIDTGLDELLDLFCNAVPGSEYGSCMSEILFADPSVLVPQNCMSANISDSELTSCVQKSKITLNKLGCCARSYVTLNLICSGSYPVHDYVFPVCQTKFIRLEVDITNLNQTAVNGTEFMNYVLSTGITSSLGVPFYNIRNGYMKNNSTLTVEMLPVNDLLLPILVSGIDGSVRISVDNDVTLDGSGVLTIPLNSSSVQVMDVTNNDVSAGITVIPCVLLVISIMLIIFM